MFKNIIRLFLLFLFTSVVGNTYASELPDLKEKEKKEVKSDSLTVKKEQKTVKSQGQEVVVKPTLKHEDTKVNYYGHEENTISETDTTSNSALSFNFIYYIIEKFKFQVE